MSSTFLLTFDVLNRKYGFSPNYFLNLKKSSVFKTHTNSSSLGGTTSSSVGVDGIKKPHASKSSIMNGTSANNYPQQTYQLQRNQHNTSSNNYMSPVNITSGGAPGTKNPTFNYNYGKSLFLISIFFHLIIN